MFKRLFGLPSAEQMAAATRLKHSVRELLQLDEDATISVNEIDCGQINCPDLQTIILVRLSGQPCRAMKIHAALMDVTNEQIRTAHKEGFVDSAAKPL